MNQLLSASKSIDKAQLFSYRKLSTTDAAHDQDHNKSTLLYTELFTGQHEVLLKWLSFIVVTYWPASGLKTDQLKRDNSLMKLAIVHWITMRGWRQTAKEILMTAGTGSTFVKFQLLRSASTSENKCVKVGRLNDESEQKLNQMHKIDPNLLHLWTEHTTDKVKAILPGMNEDIKTKLQPHYHKNHNVSFRLQDFVTQIHHRFE